MYLKMYDDTHQTLVDNYCLSEIKLRYVREPKIAIALTKKDPRRHAVLVFKNEHLVAFLSLFEAKGSSTYSDNKNSLLVQDLSTDYRHLRKGYVKQAVQLLPRFIHQHFSNIDQLTIIVNEDKAFTKALCLEVGFKDISHQLPHIYGSQVLLEIPI
ncbi:GNAT family N-acetyltransferase [Enterococcus ureasiticus]|uniref:GNAT family N-acetyltransferase n=1 Tax=Enterococcus ureasiticus TaxID=903984 RepID=A0A1E5GAI3_9ENTE|nr:GNAT family N-acetyltransferase [Enterococcus ureasiticus]OEG09703.1 GNAT family N-acetyltransferase [Enterococcus ureasiticus]